MGCARSSKFPEICENQEKIFTEMLSKYCSSNKDKVSSDMETVNNNYGLINLDSNSETFEEEKSISSCSFHWTDCLELVILGILISAVLKLGFNRLQKIRYKRKQKKLHGLRTLYREELQALPASQPSAPSQYSKSNNPYSPPQNALDNLKGNV